MIENLKYGILPKDFEFKTGQDLIRLGKDFDGGYLVSKIDVSNSDFLISLGICDDWSFENAFLKIKKVPIHAFDGSVGKWIFIQKIIINFLRINKPFRFISKINILISYLLFFRKDRLHIQKFVENDTCTDSSFNKNNIISMEEVFEKIEVQRNIFLKIDIEGSEYRLLDTLISNQSKLSGLVIEFHNCDLNYEIITNFIKRISLKLIHIHPNNASPFNKKNKIPFSLEMTFSRSCKLKDTYILPHPLDMPCDPNNEDIILSF